MQRNRSECLLAASLLAVICTTGLAQQYPTKPIRVVVPFTGGSQSDMLACILQLPDVKERIVNQGATPRPSMPEEFDRLVRAEIVTRGKVLKAAGARAE